MRSASVAASRTMDSAPIIAACDSFGRMESITIPLDSRVPSMAFRWMILPANGATTLCFLRACVPPGGFNDRGDCAARQGNNVPPPLLPLAQVLPPRRGKNVNSRRPQQRMPLQQGIWFSFMIQELFQHCGPPGRNPPPPEAQQDACPSPPAARSALQGQGVASGISRFGQQVIVFGENEHSPPRHREAPAGTDRDQHPEPFALNRSG